MRRRKMSRRRPRWPGDRSRRCTGLPNTLAAPWRCATSPWSCTLARSWPCWARTAPARAPASSCWPASTSPTSGRSCSTAKPCTSRAARRPASRHRGHAPASGPVPGPQRGREHLYRPRSHRRLGLLDRARMGGDAARLLDDGRPGLRPRDAPGPPAQLRAAAGRDRPRPVGARAGPDHGRADGRAVAARGRPPVRGGRRSPPAGRGDDVRRPPDGRDLPRRGPRDACCATASWSPRRRPTRCRATGPSG